MEAPRPMDRLVCGDVGYGKTEVALRAAFKAVMDGKQVAFLVPTTILAEQHYLTFTQRLSPFPLKVARLSRLQDAAEQREVIRGLAAGSVDICIGTHRLLQKDVSFKDLGLLIIDEEQRFGVTHKEHLKKLRLRGGCAHPYSHPHSAHALHGTQRRSGYLQYQLPSRGTSADHHPCGSI